MHLPAPLLHQSLSGGSPVDRVVQERLRTADSLDLTADELRHRGADGVPLAHLLATHGLLDRVERSLVDDDLLRLRDPEGNTVLHRAAMAEKLVAVPKEAQDCEHYTLYNRAGFTPLHLVAPLDAAEGVSPLAYECETALTLPAPDGSTPLHRLARMGGLELLPEGRLSGEMLALANNRGITVAHEATSSLCSLLVVAPLLDDTTLALRDNSAVSVLDLCAANLADYTDPLPEALAAKAADHLARHPGLERRVLSAIPPVRPDVAPSRSAQMDEHAETGLRLSPVALPPPMPVEASVGMTDSRPPGTDGVGVAH